MEVKKQRILHATTMLLPWCRFEIAYGCPYKRVDCQKMKQKGLSDHQAQNVWNGQLLHDVSFLLHRFILKLTHKNNVEHIVLDLLAGPKFFKYLWMSFDQGFVKAMRFMNIDFDWLKKIQKASTCFFLILLNDCIVHRIADALWRRAHYCLAALYPI